MMLGLTILHLNHLFEKVRIKYPLLDELYKKKYDIFKVQILESLQENRRNEMNKLVSIEMQTYKVECKDFLFNLLKNYKVDSSNQENVNNEIMLFEQEHNLSNYMLEISFCALKKKEELEENYCYLQKLHNYQLVDSSLLQLQVDYINQRCTIELKNILSTKSHNGFIQCGNLSICFQKTIKVQCSGTINLDHEKEIKVFAYSIKEEENGSYCFDLLLTSEIDYYLAEVHFFEVDTYYKTVNICSRDLCMRIRI